MPSLVEFDRSAADALHATLGHDATVLSDLGALRKYLDQHIEESAVVLGPSVDHDTAFELAEVLRVTRPTVGVILIRRRVDTQLLTEALRAGVRDVIAEDDMAGLATAVNRAGQLANALQQVGSQSADAAAHAQVVTVFSAKGGCGKTSVATNLAAILAEGGQRSVALVDLDLQFGDVAISMHLAPSRTIYDAVRMADTLDMPALRSLLTRHISGVDILVAPLDPAQADEITVELVAQAIDLLASEYDYVVIDCPPALDDRVLAAFDVSNVVALLATLDVPALKNVKLTLDTLSLIAFPHDRLRIVLNRADSKVGLEVSDVERTLGLPVAAQIPSSVDVPFAANRGVVLASESPHHPVSVSIRNLAYLIATSETDATSPAEMAGTTAGTTTGRRGGRFRRRQS